MISGCFESISLADEAWGCNDGMSGMPRVKHLWLNKDKGQIHPSIGGAHMGHGSDRGGVGDNFKRAVEAAIEDTQKKWAYLQEQIIAGNPGTGKLMICALTHDDPKKTCGQAQENPATKFNVRNTSFLTLLLMFMLYEVFGRRSAPRLGARAFQALRRFATARVN